MRNKRDLVEIFGHAPDDVSPQARLLWRMGACPFVQRECIKFNHDKTITYGTCSATSPHGEIIICPNRLYADSHGTVRAVARDAFGDQLQFVLFDEYVGRRETLQTGVVALGKHSGREVRVGQSLSMDWILAWIDNGVLREYVGLEVQSIDITGNYRDAWHAYHSLSDFPDRPIPASQHGLNWANVHKRLIPQLIRKSLVYSSSGLVKRGMYFIVPEIVFRKFEELLGEMPPVGDRGADTISVFTYGLGAAVEHGAVRSLEHVRTIRFSLRDLSQRFISGPNLPAGNELDRAVLRLLGIQQ